MKQRQILLLTLCLLLCAALPLSACAPVEDSQQARALGEAWIEYVIAEDKEAAYGMVSDLCSREEFSELWEYMRNAVGDSHEYEIKQTGWHWKSENGIAHSTVTYEITTDADRLLYLDILLADGREDLIGLYCVDSTDYADSTSALSVLGVLVTVIALAVAAFVIWMLLDCIKRPIKNKVLWIVVILLWLTVTVTYGASTFNFNFSVRIPLALSSLKRNLYAQVVTFNLAVPVGALIYFFKRKTLPLKESDVTPTVEQTPQANDDPTD